MLFAAGSLLGQRTRVDGRGGPALDRGRVGAWVRGAWVRGCVVRGCVGAWLRGRVGAWVRGCAAAWVRGCVGAWVLRRRAHSSDGRSFARSSTSTIGSCCWLVPVGFGFLTPRFFRFVSEQVFDRLSCGGGRAEAIPSIGWA